MSDNENENFIYGIDIGGTNLRVALLSCLQGRIVDFVYLRYPETGSCEAFLEHVSELLENLVVRSHVDASRLVGIGISFPGLLDSEGRVLSWPNRPDWNGFSLREFFEKRTRVPVRIEEDANAIAFGELKFGQHETDRLYSVVVGTGIGSGLIQNGELFRGLSWAGELGHTRMIPASGPVCTCGQTGCLQALASGPAILKAAQDKAAQLGQDVSLEGAYDVANLAYDHRWAHEVFEEAARWLAMGVANAIRLYDVDHVVLGGGVMEAEELFFEPFTRHLHDFLQGWPRQGQVQVVLSSLGAQAGIFGAAATILEHLEKRD